MGAELTREIGLDYISTKQEDIDKMLKRISSKKMSKSKNQTRMKEKNDIRNSIIHSDNDNDSQNQYLHSKNSFNIKDNMLLLEK